jgi:dTDP-4-amino-4,6-dideoxygalactose transaminase
MKVPMLALQREHAAIEPRLVGMWQETLASMRLLKGIHGEAFEAEISAFTGSSLAVGVASGTDALALSLIAVGVGPGDEVLLQANGFTADVEAIRIAGARPVLVDVAPAGYGPDPEALERAVTPRTRAMLVVHMYGEPVEMEPLQAICRQHELRLVEDGSHAHGARLQGRHVGAFGDAGAFSAGIIKNLGAYGDAGFVITNDPEVEREVRLLQAHGQAKKNHHVRYGFNSRLDELQAAVLRAKLPLLEERNARRREYAAYYSRELRPVCLAVPEAVPGRVDAFHQYVVQVENRGDLQAALKERGVETGVHYPVPLHRQPAWEAAYETELQFPRAEHLAARILSLPVVPDLTWEEVRYVAAAVRECVSPVPAWAS